MVYRMIFNQTAYFGRGAIKEIPGVARSHGFTKAFIVTDPVLLETGTVKKVTDVLDEAGMPYEVFDNVKPNPPVECIQDGVAKFAASGADFLIGLGGGSPQDTCKGIGIVTANPEFADVLSLEGVADTKNPSVPIFGVPTTAGTASETTINYVITDTANKRSITRAFHPAEENQTRHRRISNNSLQASRSLPFRRPTWSRPRICRPRQSFIHLRRNLSTLGTKFPLS